MFLSLITSRDSHHLSATCGENPLLHIWYYSKRDKNLGRNKTSLIVSYARITTNWENNGQDPPRKVCVETVTRPCREGFQLSILNVPPSTFLSWHIVLSLTNDCPNIFLRDYHVYSTTTTSEWPFATLYVHTNIYLDLFTTLGDRVLRFCVSPLTAGRLDSMHSSLWGFCYCIHCLWIPSHEGRS
jgi:hypothetical protein